MEKMHVILRLLKGKNKNIKKYSIYIHVILEVWRET